MNPRKRTSSFSTRVKIRRKPFTRRNNRSTSFRLLSVALSYAQGSTRCWRGGPTGVYPNAAARCRGSSPSAARSLTNAGGAGGRPARRALGPVRGRRSEPCEHQRQPAAVWWASRPEMCRWPGGRFFSRPGPVGLPRDDRAVQGDRLELDSHDLFAWQAFEDPVEDAVLGPAIHPGGDGLPLANPPWQPAPLAALLGDRQDGLEPLQIREADSAPLHGEGGGNACVLRFGEFHSDMIP